MLGRFLPDRGLGAGAALARRNPLIAAGAAVGALAADRARESVRRRQFSDSAGLLPGEGELEDWYREELGGARILARRAAGSPTALGVPSADELAQSASTAVIDGWDRLVERELLRAAEAGARWYVRWPVDLPVYAMGAWLVWSAATGFFSGEYVGFDFLLNALLILFAWLFLARTAVRTLLAGRSTQLLTDTRRFCAQALTRATGHLSDAAGEAIAARRDGLGRLAKLEERWRSKITATADEPGI
jgi:hypothetical protein